MRSMVESIEQKDTPPIKPLEKLTPRQAQVLGLLVQGGTSKEIGFQLQISSKTVDAHRMKIMQRLDIHDIAKLVQFAFKYGLLQLPD